MKVCTWMSAASPPLVSPGFWYIQEKYGRRPTNQHGLHVLRWTSPPWPVRNLCNYANVFYQNCLFVDLFIWVGRSLTWILLDSLDLLACELQESTFFSLSNTRDYMHIPPHLAFKFFLYFIYVDGFWALCMSVHHAQAVPTKNQN